jgi:hypothetical protein
MSERDEKRVIEAIEDIGEQLRLMNCKLRWLGMTDEERYDARVAAELNGDEWWT